MQLKDLRWFVAVAEELHFGRAAKRLHVSQPPVTQGIKRLEKSLGVQLFVRTKRYVQLTTAGSALLGEARRILSETDNLPRMMHDAASGQMGVLRAGFVASSVFCPARNSYLRLINELTGISVVLEEMNSMDQVRALQSGTLDIGMIYTPVESEGLASRPVASAPLVVAMHKSHRLAGSKRLSLTDLRSDAFVLPPRNLAPGFYDSIITACNAAGFSPYVPHRSRYMLPMVSLVSVNAGLTLVPGWMRSAGFPDVVFIDLTRGGPRAEISLMWDPKNASPVLARALAALKLTRIQDGKTTGNRAGRSVRVGK